MSEQTELNAQAFLQDAGELIGRLRNDGSSWAQGLFNEAAARIEADAAALAAAKEREQMLREALVALDRMLRGLDWCDDDEIARRRALVRTALEREDRDA